MERWPLQVQERIHTVTHQRAQEGQDPNANRQKVFSLLHFSDTQIFRELSDFPHLDVFASAPIEILARRHRMRERYDQEIKKVNLQSFSRWLWSSELISFQSENLRNHHGGR